MCPLRSGYERTFRIHPTEGNYKKHTDLVYEVVRNRPSWAKNPVEFFKAAEKMERANGRPYFEVRFALPEELPLTENINIVEEFIQRMDIHQHVYTYAIHDKPAALDESHRNIHVHILFNERILDPKRPSSTGLDFFIRYREDDKGQPIQGYKKRNCYNKTFLHKARATYAEFQNNYLKKHHIDQEVSHLSLKDQRKLALAKKDEDKADLLDRKPIQKLPKSVLYHNINKICELKEKNDPDFYKHIESQLKGEDALLAMYVVDWKLKQVKEEIYKEKQLLRLEEENYKVNMELRERCKAVYASLKEDLETAHKEAFLDDKAIARITIQTMYPVKFNKIKTQKAECYAQMKALYEKKGDKQALIAYKEVKKKLEWLKKEEKEMYINSNPATNQHYHARDNINEYFYRTRERFLKKREGYRQLVPEISEKLININKAIAELDRKLYMHDPDTYHSYLKRIENPKEASRSLRNVYRHLKAFHQPRFAPMNAAWLVKSEPFIKEEEAIRLQMEEKLRKGENVLSETLSLKNLYYKKEMAFEVFKIDWNVEKYFHDGNGQLIKANIVEEKKIVREEYIYLYQERKALIKERLQQRKEARAEKGKEGTLLQSIDQVFTEQSLKEDRIPPAPPVSKEAFTPPIATSARVKTAPVTTPKTDVEQAPTKGTAPTSIPTPTPTQPKEATPVIITPKEATPVIITPKEPPKETIKKAIKDTAKTIADTPTAVAQGTYNEKLWEEEESELE